MAEIDQEQIIAEFKKLGTGAWTTVYESSTAGRDVGIYCALSLPSRREQALGDGGWDISITDGGPGFSQSWPDGVETTTYHASGGTREGVEPLVLVRHFHGVAEDTVELDQQFRLFHNLRFDAATGNYYKMNNDGTQTLAIQIDGKKVSVRTSLLKQYIAARQVDLLLFIDSRAFVNEDVGLPERIDLDEPNTVGFRYYGDLMGDRRYFTRFLATKVVTPGPIETSGIWPFDDTDENYPEFIIGEDEHGKSISFTCEPDKLANYFGKNPDAPHYLTPVHFRKDVLQKYYSQPELYSVSDGRLSCAGLWGVQIDNDHEDRVVVFLGDLGRDLPSAERDYWRSFMIAPDTSISETNFKRSFLAVGTDAVAADLRFRRLYNSVNIAWSEQFGWPLFREPKESDVFMIDQVRLALNDSQDEFEEAVRLLAKLLCDSINEKGVQKALPTTVANEKGISKLERLLTERGYPHIERDIGFLRRVQELRSRTAAHLKGSDYEKVLTKNIGANRGRAAVKLLIEDGVTMLEGIATWMEKKP